MKLRSDNLARKFHNRTTPAISATGVAQIFNLLYRRIAFGRPLQLREAGRLQIRDTAECNSALRPLPPASVCEISGPARGLGAPNRAGERTRHGDVHPHRAAGHHAGSRHDRKQCPVSSATRIAVAAATANQTVERVANQFRCRHKTGDEMKTAVAKIEMLKSSMQCFVFGLLGFCRSSVCRSRWRRCGLRAGFE